ncbi:MAG: SGNH/GDSL hydrolase family protein [Clostridia bacterium]|nr:SGNH/GDSL hydrolase family protein [Clostridia bacterium]
MLELKENDVILFQGDSITDGNRGRSSDLNHVHGHGYQYIIASEMYADNLNKNIEVYNRGNSGDRICDLYGRWIEECLNLKPTILSVLIGVNDIVFNWNNNSGSDPERYEKIYRYLLDEVKEKNPETLIVIMEPFFGDKEEPELDAFFKEHIGGYQKAAKKIAEEYGAVFVPLQDLFDEYAQKTDVFNLLWDGVHPTTCGHQLIARRWKECVKPALEKR